MNFLETSPELWESTLKTIASSSPIVSVLILFMIAGYKYFQKELTKKDEYFQKEMERRDAIFQKELDKRDALIVSLTEDKNILNEKLLGVTERCLVATMKMNDIIDNLKEWLKETLKR